MLKINTCSSSLRYCSYCNSFVTANDNCPKCGNAIFSKIKHFYSII